MSGEPDTTQVPPAAWIDLLARSEADLAAGRTVTWADARARLVAELAAFETGQRCQA